MAEPAVPMSSPIEDDVSKSAKRKSSVDEIEVDLEAPEPPSKRARRAIKKGKPLPPKVDSDDEKPKSKSEAEEKAEKQRSEHSVWIGNLPFTATAADLRSWLVKNSGEVITEEKITRIKLPTSKLPGRDKTAKPENKGFAYLDFSDLGGKVAAIALSETEYWGRRLLIKDATSYEGRPSKREDADDDDKVDGAAADGVKTDPKSQRPESRKVFVGNLGFKTTEDDLRRNFEKCGEVEWVKLATFEDSGKCKGYGWIVFKTPEAAAWAVKGFVKIKEKIETEDDFREDASEDEDAGRDQKKQFKTRKWWVNRIFGRDLKIELAEDDQQRYKKRFGKDAKKDGEENGSSDRRSRAPHNGRNDRGRQSGKASDGGDGKGGLSKKQMDINEARLTGKVVEFTGAKQTFE